MNLTHRKCLGRRKCCALALVGATLLLASSLEWSTGAVQRQSAAGPSADFGGIRTSPRALSQNGLAPLEIDFTDSGSLTCNGYTIEKRSRQVMDKGLADQVCDSYVEIRRGRKRLANFDGVYYGLGNAAQFAIVPALGAETKQLVVSLDVPRGGVQWVVDLGPTLHTIFDGRAWDVGRETDDFSLVDLDGDGVFEITVVLTAFYRRFDRLSIAETPLPVIIFHYDQHAKKYLPANSLFPGYALAGTEQRPTAADPPSEANLGRALDVLFTYVFVGREQEGWKQFRQAYSHPDRGAIEATVRRVLKTHPVYRYVKQHADLARAIPGRKQI